MRYLGLDLGSRTLGVSISETGVIARSIGIIHHQEEYERLIDEVEKLVNDYKIDIVVLGYPKNMNGTIGPKGELSYKFKEMLEKRTNLEVFLEDERLTTVQATNLLIKNDTSRISNKSYLVSHLTALSVLTVALREYLDIENFTLPKLSKMILLSRLRCRI